MLVLYVRQRQHIAKRQACGKEIVLDEAASKISKLSLEQNYTESPRWISALNGIAMESVPLVSWKC